MKFYDNQNGEGYKPCEYSKKCRVEKIEETTFEDKINGKEYYVCSLEEGRKCKREMEMEKNVSQRRMVHLRPLQ